MAKNSSIFRRIVQLVIDADAARKAKAALQDALNKGTDARGIKRNLGVVDKALGGLKRTAAGLGASFLAVFAGRKLLDYADTWKLIQGRLKLVTDSSKNLGQVTEKLLGIASRTRSSFESVATLYQRVAMNADQLGKSQQEILDLTETVSKSIQIGGASASEAAAGVQQLAQALSSGRLQGDEFRSIMENMPDLARRLAEGLGVTTGELRAMSKAGELTSDVLVDAILKMKSAVDEDFKAVPVTIGGAFVELGNSIMAFVGQADEGTGASNIFADAILAVAEAADLAREALEKLDRARVNGGGQIVTRGGQEILILPPPEPQRRGPPGGDFGVDLDAAQLQAARARADALSPATQFNALLSRMESERTAQLVKAKAVSRANAKELAELNELHAAGNALLGAGNLSLEDRVRLISALSALGFEEAKAQVAQELLKLEDQRIQMLIEAKELGIITAAEQDELVRKMGEFNARLQEGNLGLEERIRLFGHVKDIAEALAERSLFRGVDFRGAVLDRGFPDLLKGRRDEAGDLRVRAPDLGVPSEEQMRELSQLWMDQHAEMLQAAESTALGVANAWSDAFRAVMMEGQGIAGFMESLFRGMGAAVLGALAQIAGAKVVENLALAFQALGMGWAQTLFGNVAGPAIGAKSAGFHFGAAALWGAIGGGAMAGQAAMAGGGSSGLSGGLPSGARDPAGRIADRATQERHTIIYIEMDPLDARNSRFQTTVGTANVLFNQRRGQRITKSRP